MSIRKALYDLLNDAEADVYPVIAPAETTDPYCTYNVSREFIRTQDGIAIYDVTLTVDCHAKDFSDLIDLAATMEAGLEGAEGTYQSETIMISSMTEESEVTYDSDLGKYMLTQTYNVFFDN